MIKKDRLLNTFLKLVQIDSPSGFEKEIAQHVSKILTDLGGVVEFDSFGNVIAKFKGEGEPLILNAHLDTVEPGRGIKPVVTDDMVTSDGTTVLGGDPKAGVAIILETLYSLFEEKTSHVPLEVVFTLSEETGLTGALNLDYSKLQSKRGLTFDGEEEVHTINISAPGYNSVDITITGRSAHAGVEPEKGISAIQIASEVIANLKLGRIDEETTANIGLITGGSARNAVPETVTIKGEIRSRDVKKLKNHTKHFQEAFEEIRKKHPEAHLNVTIKTEFHPYLLDKTHRVIQDVSKVFAQMNKEPLFIHSGGGTDVNIFHTHEIEAIVVGGCFYNAHTTREYVIIPQMVQAAEFCEKIVAV